MALIRGIIRLFGALCMALAIVLGLLALAGYLLSDDTSGRVNAAVFGVVAVVLLVLGNRARRHSVSSPSTAGSRHRPAPRQTMPPDRPTEKQRKYAARLGIDVTPSMSAADASAAISEVERCNPSLARRRQHVKEKVRARRFGQELLDQETSWDRFADEVGYMLAVYTHAKQTVVDVLRVNEAFITQHGHLKLGVEAPKVVKDRHIGNYLEWDKHFELPVNAVLYYEPLHVDFHDDGNDAYHKMVKKGLKIAKKLPL